jgi:DNA-binding beta-propeller fold protein YncE
MRAACFSVIAVLFLLAVSTATGQWLERTIWLTDSISDLGHASHIVHIPATNRMYVAGSYGRSLQIYDADARRKTGALDLESVVGFCDFDHCYRSNRVYVLMEESFFLMILDDRTDSVVKLMGGFEDEGDGAYNPCEDKYYLLDDLDVIYVFDPGPDTVLKVIDPPQSLDQVVVDSTHNRLYAKKDSPRGSPIAVVVVDCSGDSVIDSLPGPDGHCSDIVVYEERSRLYALGYSDLRQRRELWVYDTDSLRVRDTVALSYWNGPVSLRPFVNPVSGYLYIVPALDPWDGEADSTSRADTIAVFDCSAESVVGTICLPERSRAYYSVRGFTVNPLDGRAYLGVTAVDSIAVLGSPDSITGWIPLGASADGLGWNSTTNELFCAGRDNFLYIIDGTTDSVVYRADYRHYTPYSLQWIPSGRKLYVADDHTVAIVGPDDTIIGNLDADGVYDALAFHPDLTRIYWGNYHHLLVSDCNADTLLDSVYLPSPRQRGLLLSDLHKLYLPGDSLTGIYDVYAESLLGYRSGFGMYLARNPRTGLVYGWDPLHAGRAGLVLVDPVGDTVLQTLCRPLVSQLVVNSTLNEAYYVLRERSDLVFVLDGSTHELIDSIVLPRPVWQLVWVEREDKLYALSDSAVYAIRCPAREVARAIPVQLGLEDPRPVLYNDRNHKLWVADRDTTFVISCRTDSIVAAFATTRALDIAWNPIDNFVYVGCYPNLLCVFGDDMSGIERAGGFGVRAELRLPTILRGPELARVDCRVIDALGRDVTDRREHLAPGVYFLHSSLGIGHLSLVTTKVIVQR